MCASVCLCVCACVCTVSALCLDPEVSFGTEQWDFRPIEGWWNILHLSNQLIRKPPYIGQVQYEHTHTPASPKWPPVCIELFNNASRWLWASSLTQHGWRDACIYPRRPQFYSILKSIATTVRGVSVHARLFVMQPVLLICLCVHFAVPEPALH